MIIIIISVVNLIQNINYKHELHNETEDCRPQTSTHTNMDWKNKQSTNNNN